MISLFVCCVASKLSLAAEERSFVSWMRENGYLFTGDEYYFRLGVFLTNQRAIQEINRRKKSYSVSLNQYAHYTKSELDSMLNQIKGTKNMDYTPFEQRSSINDIPDSVDWREKGVVTTPMNQGSCGCCWACAITAALESLHAVRGNPLTSFSIQKYVDCVTVCRGCGGCMPNLALDFILKEYSGLSVKNEDYPFSGYQANCRSIEPKYGSLKSFGFVKSFDEEEMKKYVSLAPVIITSKSSIMSFVFYSGGIYEDEQCMGLDYDHAMVAVGYGSENGVDYWIIKNSMGTNWGEKGYIRIVRGKNMCGVASFSVFVA